MEKLEKWRQSVLGIVAHYSTTAPSSFREFPQEVLYVDGMDSHTTQKVSFTLSWWKHSLHSSLSWIGKKKNSPSLFKAFQIWAANQPALHWMNSSLGIHPWRPLLLEDVHLLFKCISFPWKFFTWQLSFVKLVLVAFRIIFCFGSERKTETWLHRRMKFSI